MKRALAAVLAVLVIFALAACNKTVDEPVQTTKKVDPTQPTEPVQPTVEPDAMTTYEYIYDDEGRVLEAICFMGGEEYERQVYRYDEKGNMVEDAYFLEGKEMSRNTYAFDELGNLTEQVYYEEGKESIRDVNRFDAEGNILENSNYVDGELCFSSVYEYDENGNLLWEEHRNEVEFTRYTYQYEFQDGKVVEERCYEDYGDPTIVSLTRYDGLGRVVDQIDYTDGTETFRDIFEYTGPGGELERVTYYYLGEQTGYELFSYVNGKLAWEKFFYYEDSEGNEGEFCDYSEYDDEGQRVLESFVANGQEQYRTSYTYEDGNCVLEAVFDDGTEVERWERSYDKQDNLLSETYFVEGEQVEHYTFAYDAAGNLTTQKRFENDREVERWTYVYDVQGNLLEETYTEF